MASLIDRIKSTNLGDLVERAVATFIETAAGSLLMAWVAGLSQAGLKTAIAAAIATGISAVKTLLKQNHTVESWPTPPTADQRIPGTQPGS